MQWSTSRQLAPLMRLALLALTLGQIGCSKELPPSRVTVLDFRGTDADETPLFGTSTTTDLGLTLFESGWSTPEGPGIWATAPTAVLHTTASGREAELRIRCSTRPELASKGQTLEVVVNGRALHHQSLPGAWEIATILVPIPDDVLLDGLNTFFFRSRYVHEPAPDEQDARKFAVFFHQIELSAQLTQAEHRQHLDRAILQIPESGWENSTVTTQPAASNRPDVVMVILDAARADHFGCYGYPRDTSPFVDALAEEGLRFENVFSTAAYTPAAIASLFSARSWRDHRVFSMEDALADSFMTIAEVMNSNGYSTLAYSANGHVSPATNADQGFDEFTDVWSHEQQASVGAIDLPVRLLEDRLRQGLDPKPAFAYMHLIPPHEPYTPGPDFDLWSDPSYDGFVNGSLQSIERLLFSDGRFDPRDRDQAIDLYDGHLRRGDDLVRSIVDSWKRHRQDRELVVIVLSDHGEAFGEHDFFSHNHSVHDEMTRIPLVMWPSDLCQSLAPAESAFLSITDVFPMMVHMLGLELPRGHQLPQRFADVVADPATPRSAIVLRSAGRMLGLRTPRHLAITDGWARQELYDLQVDPFAQLNRRLTNPELYAGMTMRLASILSDYMGTGEAPRSNLSAEDREALRALGYL